MYYFHKRMEKTRSKEGHELDRLHLTETRILLLIYIFKEKKKNTLRDIPIVKINLSRSHKIFNLTRKHKII